jgi:hypothetical protein
MSTHTHTPFPGFAVLCPILALAAVSPAIAGHPSENGHSPGAQNSLRLSAEQLDRVTASGNLVEQDPTVTGQDNVQWGKTASWIAQLPTPEGTSGGGMGEHSRSTQAANINGGFTSDNNAFGIQFNVKDEDGNAGRDGVGNVSQGAGGAPHETHPGDGGNGQHALNNSFLDPNDQNTPSAGFSNVLNPVTGELGGLDPATTPFTPIVIENTDTVFAD